VATKAELCEFEDAGWIELMATFQRFTPAQMLELGYYADGWSAKDLLAHIACWQAEAEQVLMQIRGGTHTPGSLDVDGLNVRFYESNKDLPLFVVKAECWAARTRMLTELGDLPELTPAAEEWFVESGAEHYHEHLPRLREWLGELEARSP
jgi:hypothetical protein